MEEGQNVTGEMAKRILLIGLVVAAGAAVWLAPKVLRRLEMQGLKAITVARGLDHPWSLAFLPDGRMLVTERPGRMRIVSASGEVGDPVAGLPPVLAEDEGGLMAVVLDPRFQDNSTIYWSFSEPAGPGGRTAVAAGRLDGNRVSDVKVIVRDSDGVDAGEHYGSRLLFTPDGQLLVGLGDRSKRNDAQSLASLHGKILRVESDGRPAAGNPFLTAPEARPEIWTTGHRNVQGLAFHPDTGELWATEHGPRGGDELNVIEAGRNYGWPVISYGCEYRDCAVIGEGPEKAGLEQPIAWWGPISNAPSGMTFLTSDRYPEWKGQLFVAELRGQSLLRIKLAGHQVVEQQKLATGLVSRVRDVRQGPDGWLYILTDESDGRIIRLER
jgi:glucose/arabinose dehydrogenase